MVFERQSYLQELISAEGNEMIKIVTRTRRCGKSYLLFNLYRSQLLKRGVYEDHLIQVNLEDRRNKHLRNPDALTEAGINLSPNTIARYLAHPSRCVSHKRGIAL